jgi:methylthioribose-1-phosphate isomerase
MWFKEPMAPAGIKVRNPAFDVTDAALISGIVTERGIALPPFETSLARLMGRQKA